MTYIRYNGNIYRQLDLDTAGNCILKEIIESNPIEVEEKDNHQSKKSQQQPRDWWKDNPLKPKDDFEKDYLEIMYNRGK